MWPVQFHGAPCPVLRRALRLVLQSAVAILKFLTVLEQGALCFHLALGPEIMCPALVSHTVSYKIQRGFPSRWVSTVYGLGLLCASLCDTLLSSALFLHCEKVL